MLLEWDARKATANLRKHPVRFDDAARSRIAACARIAALGLLSIWQLTSAHAQQQNSASATPCKSIYCDSVAAAVSEMDKQWGHLATGNPRGSDYRRMVIAVDESVRADYPAEIDGRHFERLSFSQLAARRRSLKRDFPVLVIRPAETRGEAITIAVQVYWVSAATKRGIALGYSDWAIVSFRLNTIGSFSVSKVELGGI